MSAGRLTEAADVRRFILAGKAHFTLVSEKSGARFTYRAGRPDGADPERPIFFSVLSGPDNTQDYSFIGTVFPKEGRTWQVQASAKSKVDASAQSARALAYLVAGLNREVLPPMLEVWHEGRCCKCGRKLTTPESIERGVGPECIKHM